MRPIFSLLFVCVLAGCARSTDLTSGFNSGQFIGYSDRGATGPDDRSTASAAVFTREEAVEYGASLSRIASGYGKIAALLEGCGWNKNAVRNMWATRLAELHDLTGKNHPGNLTEVSFDANREYRMAHLISAGLDCRASEKDNPLARPFRSGKNK